jgi:hypothetical protein
MASVASPTPTRYRRRRIPWRHPLRSIYRFQSRLNQRTELCESRLEFSHLFWLEWVGGIQRYITQPVTLSVRIGRRIRHYTADVLMLLRDERLVFREVKHSRQLRKPEVRDLLEAVRAACHDRGIGFEIVTEAEIHQTPLGALRILYNYAHDTPPAGTLEEFIAGYEPGTQTTLGDAFQRCRAIGRPKSDVAYWMFFNHLGWCADDRLHADMPLTLPTE